MSKANDLRNNRKAIEANEKMNEPLTNTEIVKAIEEIRESAPGEDGARIGYIKLASQELKTHIITLVQNMFTERADKWDGLLKGGLIVPLFKKGDRNECKNYMPISYGKQNTG